MQVRKAEQVVVAQKLQCCLRAKFAKPPSLLAIKIGVGHTHKQQSVFFQQAVRFAQGAGRIFELLETVPDEDSLRFSQLRGIVFERQLLYGCALPAGKCRSGFTNVETSWPPAPFFRGLQEGSKMASEFEDFGIVPQLRQVLRALILEGAHVAGG